LRATAGASRAEGHPVAPKGARRVAPDSTRRFALRLAAAASAAVLSVLSCASPNLSIEVVPSGVVKAPPSLGFNPEEALGRGEYLELESLFRAMPRAELDANAAYLAAYGKALLARGDIDSALPLLNRAIDREKRLVRRAELEWALAQAYIFWDDPDLALEFAQAARRDGYGLLPGYLNFLEAIRSLPLYAGPAYGESHDGEFSMQQFDLIRLPVRVNGTDSAAILDTGAAYTILTQSFAQSVGVREIPDSKAYGRGLHTKEFPLTFGIIDRLEFVGFSVQNVPVMLMPDDALMFETSRGQFPVPMVLGLHLIKQFRVGLDYGKRRISLERVDFRGAGRDPEQNLFVARGRLFARASINRYGWYEMLLDTGSEPTMLTSGGVVRAKLSASGKFYPKTLYGLGKSQAEWARVDSVTIGLSEYAVRFQSLVVKEDDGALEDGILGNSFFQNFRVSLDFKRMRVALERP
jgi:predicted aspartyl protease